MPVKYPKPAPQPSQQPRTFPRPEEAFQQTQPLGGAGQDFMFPETFVGRPAGMLGAMPQPPQAPAPAPPAPQSHLRYKLPGGEWQEFQSGQDPQRGGFAFFETPESQAMGQQRELETSQRSLQLQRMQPFQEGMEVRPTVGEELGLRGQERIVGARDQFRLRQLELLQQELGQLNQDPEFIEAMRVAQEIIASPTTPEEVKAQARMQAQAARQRYEKAYQQIIARHLAMSGKGLPGQFFE